jgi:hypothetical protein
MKIYIVKHGEYEDTKITLVTFDIDKACKFLIEKSKGYSILDVINGIEVWENDEKIIEYGNLLTIHLVNILSKKELESDNGWIKIRDDMLKFINEIKDDSNG